MLESPSGGKINPLFIRSVVKNKHWRGGKFYLTLAMQGGHKIEYEHLSSAAADDLMRRVELLISQSLESATVYDEAYEAGREHGYEDGYANGSNEGYNNAFQEAKGAFWAYEREEYRLNDYNIGYEAGKRDADERQSETWNNGYIQGQSDAKEELEGKVSDLEAEVSKLKSANRILQQRAQRAEATLTAPIQGSETFSPKGNRRYGALRRSLARLFHPDHSSGSAFEKAIREELFKEIWSEIEAIEKRYAE